MRLSGMGSIRPMEDGRCRKWQVIARAIDESGRRRQFTKVVHGGKRDAQKSLAELRDEVEGRIEAAESVGAYMDRWLEWLAASANHSTYATYRAGLRAFRPLIGDMSFETLTPGDMRSAIASLLAHRSRSTVRLYCVALSKCMHAAVGDGLLVANPMDDLRLPVPKREERPALKPDELDNLWESVVAEDARRPERIAVLLMIDCGLRGVECRKLPVECVRDGCVVVGDSKTNAGRGRRIPMTERLSEELDKWMEWREGLNVDGPMLVRADGTPLASHTVADWWRARRTSWGCEDITLHGLRHSNLSKMARYMGAHDLMRWAGWSSLSMALVYVHDDDMQLRAAVQRAQFGAKMVHVEERGEKTG